MASHTEMHCGKGLWESGKGHREVGELSDHVRLEGGREDWTASFLTSVQYEVGRLFKEPGHPWALCWWPEAPVSG